jgi:hypothetical protein
VESAVTIWTQRRRVLDDIGTALGKPLDVVDLEEGLAIVSHEWRLLLAKLTPPTSFAEHPRLHVGPTFIHRLCFCRVLGGHSLSRRPSQRGTPS